MKPIPHYNIKDFIDYMFCGLIMGVPVGLLVWFTLEVAK